jgi:hypothetical protein
MRFDCAGYGIRSVAFALPLGVGPMLDRLTPDLYGTPPISANITLLHSVITFNYR